MSSVSKKSSSEADDSEPDWGFTQQVVNGGSGNSGISNVGGEQVLEQPEEEDDWPICVITSTSGNVRSSQRENNDGNPQGNPEQRKNLGVIVTSLQSNQIMQTENGEKCELTDERCDVKTANTGNKHIDYDADTKKQRQTPSSSKEGRIEMKPTSDQQSKFSLIAASGCQVFSYCEICRTGFIKQGQLQKHMKEVHAVCTDQPEVVDSSLKSAEKPEQPFLPPQLSEPIFSCDLCETTFPNKDNLDNHMKSHQQGNISTSSAKVSPPPPLKKRPVPTAVSESPPQPIPKSVVSVVPPPPPMIKSPSTGSSMSRTHSVIKCTPVEAMKIESPSVTRNSTLDTSPATIGKSLMVEALGPRASQDTKEFVKATSQLLPTTKTCTALPPGPRPSSIINTSTVGISKSDPNTNIATTQPHPNPNRPTVVTHTIHSVPTVKASTMDTPKSITITKDSVDEPLPSQLSSVIKPTTLEVNAKPQLSSTTSINEQRLAPIKKRPMPAAPDTHCIGKSLPMVGTQKPQVATSSVVVDPPSASSKANPKESQNSQHVVVKQENSGPPYQCTSCDRKFPHPFLLKKHMLVHNKPYECSMCSERFIKIEAMNLHKRLIHDVAGMSTFKCIVCGKNDFLLLSDMYTHRMEDHCQVPFQNEKEKPFGCGVCHKPWLRKGDALVCAVLGHNPTALQEVMFQLKCPKCPVETQLGYHSIKSLQTHWDKEHPHELFPEDSLLEDNGYSYDPPLPKVEVDRREAYDLKEKGPPEGKEDEMIIEFPILANKEAGSCIIPMFPCADCPLTFIDVDSLRIHEQVHLQDEGPPPPSSQGPLKKRGRPRKHDTLASAMSPSPISLVQPATGYRRGHHLIPKFGCVVCGQKFRKLKRLREHEQTHRNMDPNCPTYPKMPGRGAGRKQGLNTKKKPHNIAGGVVKSRGRPRKVPSWAPPASNEGNEGDDSEGHSGPIRAYSCQLCPASFHAPKSLRMHELNVHKAPHRKPGRKRTIHKNVTVSGGGSANTITQIKREKHETDEPPPLAPGRIRVGRLEISTKFNKLIKQNAPIKICVTDETGGKAFHFQCPLCPKVFRDKRGIHLHILGHSLRTDAYNEEIKNESVWEEENEEVKPSAVSTRRRTSDRERRIPRKLSDFEVDDSGEDVLTLPQVSSLADVDNKPISASFSQAVAASQVLDQNKKEKRGRPKKIKSFPVQHMTVNEAEGRVFGNVEWDSEDEAPRLSPAVTFEKIGGEIVRKWPGRPKSGLGVKHLEKKPVKVYGKKRSKELEEKTARLFDPPTCEICQKTFDSATELWYHGHEVHKSTKVKYVAKVPTSISNKETTKSPAATTVPSAITSNVAPKKPAFLSLLQKKREQEISTASSSSMANSKNSVGDKMTVATVSKATEIKKKLEREVNELPANKDAVNMDMANETNTVVHELPKERIDGKLTATSSTSSTDAGVKKAGRLPKRKLLKSNGTTVSSRKVPMNEKAKSGSVGVIGQLKIPVKFRNKDVLKQEKPLIITGTKENGETYTMFKCRRCPKTFRDMRGFPYHALCHLVMNEKKKGVSTASRKKKDVEIEFDGNKEITKSLQRKLPELIPLETMGEKIERPSKWVVSSEAELKTSPKLKETLKQRDDETEPIPSTSRTSSVIVDVSKHITSNSFENSSAQTKGSLTKPILSPTSNEFRFKIIKQSVILPYKKRRGRPSTKYLNYMKGMQKAAAALVLPKTGGKNMFVAKKLELGVLQKTSKVELQMSNKHKKAGKKDMQEIKAKTQDSLYEESQGSKETGPQEISSVGAKKTSVLKIGEVSSGGEGQRNPRVMAQNSKVSDTRLQKLTKMSNQKVTEEQVPNTNHGNDPKPPSQVTLQETAQNKDERITEVAKTPNPQTQVTKTEKTTDNEMKSPAPDGVAQNPVGGKKVTRESVRTPTKIVIQTTDKLRTRQEQAGELLKLEGPNVMPTSSELKNTKIDTIGLQEDAKNPVKVETHHVPKTEATILQQMNLKENGETNHKVDILIKNEKVASPMLESEKPMDPTNIALPAASSSVTSTSLQSDHEHGLHYKKKAKLAALLAKAQESVPSPSTQHAHTTEKSDNSYKEVWNADDTSCKNEETSDDHTDKGKVNNDGNGDDIEALQKKFMVEEDRKYADNPNLNFNVTKVGMALSESESFIASPNSSKQTLKRKRGRPRKDVNSPVTPVLPVHTPPARTILRQRKKLEDPVSVSNDESVQPDKAEGFTPPMKRGRGRPPKDRSLVLTLTVPDPPVLSLNTEAITPPLPLPVEPLKVETTPPVSTLKRKLQRVRKHSVKLREASLVVAKKTETPPEPSSNFEACEILDNPSIEDNFFSSIKRVRGRPRKHQVNGPSTSASNSSAPTQPKMEVQETPVQPNLFEALIRTPRKTTAICSLSPDIASFVDVGGLMAKRGRGRPRKSMPVLTRADHDG